MENEGSGGSYIRQADGSLKLVERTQEAKPGRPPAPAKTTADEPAKKGR